MSGRKIAGGMSYQTVEGVDYSFIEYLSGNGEGSSEILEKNKDYYLASANKVISRLELAEARITHLRLPEKEANLLDEKISNGINWLNNLKIDIKQVKNNSEFDKTVSYKKWHAVKLIPSAAEGYAISLMFEEKLGMNKNIKDTNSHIRKAEKIFIKLLNLSRDSNFKLAEEQRIKAYKELDLVFKGLMINHSE